MNEEIDRILALSGKHSPLLSNPTESMNIKGYHARYYTESNFYMGVKNSKLWMLDGNTMVMSDHGLIIPWLLKASTFQDNHSHVIDQSTSINLGVVHGINLNLINPISHENLDDLLNEGKDTVATQEGSHGGSDDERSVILEGYTLILPTILELSALSTDIETNNPEALGYYASQWNPSHYWSATEGNFLITNYWRDNKHQYLHMHFNDKHEFSDEVRNWVVFEVLKSP
ncbi:hypothetical protein [Bathymodiolus platifrons methanotrophic gill symbiont]|uniref:hypothetical protein n=1 Tax=Bathymodiolus platifrons methanotrophic gill symbiont TaxID=113268 RepID=UPI001C8E0831|nr:hypothetical protein [Bathymodiolus platifrons methanotrophic gill symbiont]